MTNLSNPAGNILHIERVFDAPRELVWRAWTEPERVMKWWGPKNFTSPACEIDLRVGGAFLFCMRRQDGWDLWSTGAYREIAPHERLVFTDSFADSEGNVVPATAYGFGDDFPMEMLVTVTFEDVGGGTQMVFVQEGHPGTGVSDSPEQGWNECFDKLAAGLK